MITDLFPKISPSLDLNFARAQKLDSRITFSRPSAATYFDRNGILRTAASGVPRFDFDPITGACKGLLIEEQRTNLLTYSEQFDNAAWVKTRSSITANVTTAPDGTVTADKLIADTSSTSHYVGARPAVTSGTKYTYSVYAKAGEYGFLGINFFTDNSAFAFSAAYFDLVNGIAANASCDSVSITPVGNGWYRCSATETATATVAEGLSVVVGLLVCQSASPGHTGNGTSGIYIWGAQLEAGSRLPTSYIKTEASQVTRVDDVASIAGANFMSFYRQDEGTFVAKFDSIGSKDENNTAYIFCVSSPTANYYPTLGLEVNDQSVNRLRGTIYSDTAVSQLNGVYGPNNSIVFGTQYTGAMAYKTNDAQLAQSGSLIGTNDTSVVLPVAVDRLYIGNFYTAGNRPLNGHISRLAYYPKRLTNTELQALTA